MRITQKSGGKSMLYIVVENFKGRDAVPSIVGSENVVAWLPMA